MSNPFISGLLQQANSATAPKNSVNEPNKHARLTHNTFNIGYSHACTMRYSDIHPFYICEGVAGDKNPLYSTHELKTYTLKAPQMSGLSMKKGYFAVPYKAILPLNYDKIFVNPKKGSDVPDDVNTVFSFSSNTFNSVLRGTVNPTDFESFTKFLKGLFLLEMFFSNGSLLHALGYKIACTFNCTSYDGDTFYSFDSLFDYFMGQLLNDYGVIIKVPRSDPQEEGSYNIYRTSQDIEINQDPAIVCSPQRMIELMRHNLDFEVIQIGRSDVYEESDFAENVNMFINSVFNGQTDFCSFDNRPLNFSRLIAYQLSTNVFFSNDDIDYIYTANIYRQVQQSFVYKLFALTNLYFSFNGVNHSYDALSGRVCFSMLSFALDYCFVGRSDVRFAGLAYIFNVFQFNKSLRFSDYFLGSRINPLAVGDINAPVVGNNVSAIDMTKSISMQRFVNYVNKIPSTIVGYLRDMFGVSPAADLTEPSYLGVTKSNIGGFEVENTANDQGKLVTNLAASGGDFAFEVDIADPCIIIGLAWFEQPRYYSATIERNMFHVDRFDDFQPMLQYIGDQDIKCAEFYAKAPYSEPYSYTLRNMEYKQRFAQATGGFVENLKGWLNVVDNPSEPQNMEEEYYYLNPDVIRSKAYEFDKYYESLTGLSLGSYFHFQIVFHNKNNVTRPMAVAPEILA